MSGTFRPVEVPDLGATLSRMAQIDAQRQTLDIQRQAAKQEAGFNATLGELGPALAAGQGPEYSAALGRLFAAGPRGATMALPMLQAERQRAEAEAFWQQSQGGAPVAAGVPVAPRQAGEPPPEIQAAIAEASRETGIPIPILTAQLRQESNWNPNARGRSGEIGVAQIMPATARAPGYGVQPADPATLSDPRTNILFGARYLAGRGRAAGVTDWNDPAQVDRALAAYNGGGDPNYVRNVRQWLPQDGATPAPAPSQAGGVNPAEMALIERALSHPNPQVQQQGRARLEMLRLRQQNNPEQYVPATETIGGRQVQGQRNTRTGQFTPFPGQTGADAAGGPFAGTGMDAQANNIVLRLADKVRSGSASAEEQALYQRAYTHLAEGQMQFIPDPSDPTGQRQVAVRVPRNMGDLPPPVSGGGAPATVPTQAGQGGAAGLTSPAQAMPGNDATAVPTVPNAIPGMERTTPPPAGFQRRADGQGVEPIPGGPQDPTRQPLSESQGRSNMFGAQMLQANDILGRIPVPNGATIIAWRNAPEAALNPALGADAQQYFNAVRLFAAGILRKETGAAFTSQELLDVQSRFFPMPGDSAAVLRQKADARRQAIESMRAEIPGGFRGQVPSSSGNAPPAPPAGFRIVQ